MTRRSTRAALSAGWLFVALVLLDCGSCARQPAKDTLAPEGTPCQLDDECDTGLCDVVPGTSARVCLRKCGAGCRDVEQCTKLNNERYACVPQKAGLCSSCRTDADCPYPADKCITLGNDRFCGRDCSFDEQCPPTFRCADGIDLNGNTAPKQCQPSSGSCACIASTAGQMMPCEVANSFGRCLGSITCNPPMGWSACSARTPVAEQCNGRDDDCDGMTDEDIADVTCGVGACERRASGCTNGRPATCTPGAPDLETCNRLDDNCDGRVDENFDLQNDVGNCGTCNRACSFTNAVPKCDMGTCAIDRCVAGWTNLDGVLANGCEHPCTVTNNGVEVCDGRDNNCDGRTDEGFDLVGDPTNCGQCGLVCTVSNGSVSTYRCNAGRCAVGMCVMGRGDCNQSFADGCEENLVTSLTHCGQCGNACMPANATGTCQMGTCRIQTCNSGFRDCNMQVVDGCEVNTAMDLNNCGQCGQLCSAPNAAPTCASGMCTYTCNSGFWDVDGNRANGCEYQCVRTNNGVEACDMIDNDCDGQVDEDFNLMTNPMHCGMCNRTCTPPNFAQTTTCMGGSCAITSCVPGRGNCNSNYADGCEVDTNVTTSHCGQCGNACSAPSALTYSCTSGQCGILTCAAGRGNCDTSFTNGCETNTTTSLAHCGGCNQACTIANGSAQCVNSQCRVGTCTAPFRDCNMNPADGCEINSSNDVMNCGQCGTVCSRAGSTASCVNSLCSFVCAPGFVDLDGSPANGCEYMCTASGSDLPDPGFVDSDCDGVDGNVGSAIFVAKTGNDSFPGTRAQPMLTIGAAITAAAATNGARTAVFVSEGQYDEAVTMANGISVYGAYSAANGWRRSATYVTTINSPQPVGVTAQGLGLPLELQYVRVISANATGQEPNGDGRSSAAILAVNVFSTFTVRNVTLLPGSGSAGAAGGPGSVGTAGQRGGDGLASANGAGGSSACGATGGAGGVGVAGENDGNPGIVGTAASGGAAAGNPGSGGTRGNCNATSATNGGNAPPVTAGGTQGSPGTNAFAASTLGSLSIGGVYQPAAGLGGGAGQTGGGGGGGGSGGGTQRGSSPACLGCSNLTSGGGGGGGGGGCGGTGGQGGRGGGGSFGILANSAIVAVINTNVTLQPGGSGGPGGAGGAGGEGGGTGLNATSGGAGQEYTGSCNNKRAGNGAGGAPGGSGGQGGGGSGGAGGPSICVAYRGNVPNTTNLGCPTTVAPAPGGTGGSNGTSLAAPGPAGVVVGVQVLP